MKVNLRPEHFTIPQPGARLRNGISPLILFVLRAAVLGIMPLLLSGQYVLAAAATSTPTPTVDEAAGSGWLLIFILAGGLVVLTIVMIVVVAAMLKKFKNWPSGR